VLFDTNQSAKKQESLSSLALFDAQIAISTTAKRGGESGRGRRTQVHAATFLLLLMLRASSSNPRPDSAASSPVPKFTRQIIIFLSHISPQ